MTLQLFHEPHQKLDGLNRIVVIGAGFIGVKELLGNGSVKQVLLANGEVIEADAVILSLGYAPNTELAKNMGLELNAFGFVKADQYRRTSLPDIFAAGDCAEKVDFSTGKLSRIMLASTACTEARTAGLNLYELNTYSTFKGTVGIYSTCIGEFSFGVAGIIESAAVAEGFHIVTGSFTGVDRHPGKIPDAHSLCSPLLLPGSRLSRLRRRWQNSCVFIDSASLTEKPRRFRKEAPGFCLARTPCWLALACLAAKSTHTVKPSTSGIRRCSSSSMMAGSRR